MKPRLSPALRRFALVFAGLFWLAVFWFFAPSSCHGETRLLPGMIAAHRMGLTHYLEIERNGRPDAVAVIRYNGAWWWYHPSLGATGARTPMVRTGISTTEPPPHQVWLWSELRGVSGKWAWRRVPPMSKWANRMILPNGCLIKAIEDVRRDGGQIREIPGHAYRVALR